MADITKSYIDLNGLKHYDGKIKDWVEDQIEALDVSEFALAEKNASDIITIHGISETDGEIAVGNTAANDISFAKVAATGDAEDVDYDHTTSGLTATDVQAAIDELAVASAGGVASKTIWLHDDSAGQSEYAKVYNLYQGENDYVADRTDGKTNPTLKGTINIAKDKVVQSGSVVDIVFKSSDNTLHEGTESGTDVTTLIKPTGTPTAADAGKYIKLVLQNVINPLYIAAGDLVDVYSGGTTAEVIVDVTGGVITATIDKISGSKIIYKNETTSGAGDGETVNQALARLDGSDSTTGSVAKKVKDAIDALDADLDASGTAAYSGTFVVSGITQINGVLTAVDSVEVEAAGAAATAIAALDTPADVILASVDGTTGNVSFTQKIDETDGIVGAVSGDKIVFAAVANTTIDSECFPTT